MYGPGTRMAMTEGAQLPELDQVEEQPTLIESSSVGYPLVLESGSAGPVATVPKCAGGAPISPAT
jgi:hypothetical protein